MLIEFISVIKGIERIRFTTSHPVEFSDNLIKAYSKTKKLSHEFVPFAEQNFLVFEERLTWVDVICAIANETLRETHCGIYMGILMSDTQILRPPSHLELDDDTSELLEQV